MRDITSTTRSGAGLLLLSLLCTGCNNAPSSSAPSEGGVAAQAASSMTADRESELRDRIDRMRAVNLRRYMNTREHAAWQLVHGILAYQDQLQVDHITIDPATKADKPERVSALKLLLEKGSEVRGFTLQPRADGLLATVVEGGSKTGQGHPNQWLGYLLVDYPPREGRQPTVTLDTKVNYRDRAGGVTQYTIRQMLEAAKLSLRDRQESGWSLIALTAFPEAMPLDREWDVTHSETPDAREITERWSIERILAMEYQQEFHSSACGGTHRLIGMSLALQRYRDYLRKQKKPIALTGGWAQADEMVNWGVRTIKEYQQADGAFSANWLTRPGTSSDVAVRIRTTGHCLEFLSLTLPTEELAQPWAARAAAHLCDLFEQTTELPLDCGGTYHALHGLQIYREKVWGVPGK